MNTTTNLRSRVLAAILLAAPAASAACAAELPDDPEAGVDAVELQAGDDLSMAPRMVADTAADRLKARGALRCMQAFATESYKYMSDSSLGQGLCGFYLLRDISTDVLKIYSNYTSSTITLMFAFAGSRSIFTPTGFGDWVLDLRSQANTVHESPLDSSNNLGTVGSGWEVRWRNQATHKNQAGRSPADRLIEAISEAKQSNRALRVFVTGHSLGAVSAELAAYDIAWWLRRQGIRQEVWATIFNPPRLGLAGAQGNYQTALVNSCSGPTAGKLCLGLWSMTRSLDPVQSLPAAMTQAVWQTTPGARTLNTGPHSASALPYCPQYNAPAASFINGIANHDLARWASDVTSNVTDAHLSCMFNPFVAVKLVSAASAHGVPGGEDVACFTGPSSPSPNGESSTCPVLHWGGVTFWPYSYFDNRVSMGIVGYNSAGNIVAQVEKPGARYVWKIDVDATARTVTFWGQANQKVVMTWAELSRLAGTGP